MSSEQREMSFMSELAELVLSDANQSIEAWPVNSNDSRIYGPEQHIEADVESCKSTVTTTTLGTVANEVKKSRKRGRDDYNDGIYLLALAAQHDLYPLDQVVNDVSDAESSTRSP